MREWKRTRSGLIVPFSTAMAGEFTKRSYLDVKMRGIALQRLCDSLGVRIPKTSALRRMLSSTDALWKTWFSGKLSQIQFNWLLDSLSLDAISSATLPLEGEPDAAKYLRVLVKSDLGILSRGRSLGKDFFWELEVWSKLKYRGALRRWESPTLCGRSMASRRASRARRSIRRGIPSGCFPVQFRRSGAGQVSVS